MPFFFRAHCDEQQQNNNKQANTEHKKTSGPTFTHLFFSVFGSARNKSQRDGFDAPLSNFCVCSVSLDLFVCGVRFFAFYFEDFVCVCAVLFVIDVRAFLPTYFVAVLNE